ncbi:hypothetical protein FLAG1_03452 [Fusarium langsethiae]|uniref:Uncharacterized protein n=1 Tax=Fusarium langsethiae TaxID=179993 RepID=A0A0M9F0F2_FUSLA|nr:hypothetical protein FLAG1_03452 [Fusarium langsethiae]GKU01487.1 unnamed protein product [Fusarium langsethiae]GKU15867.1 unnamed protein product [Fusarium langsethiae]
MRFFIILLLAIRLGVGIASYFFFPAYLGLERNRASKEDCPNGIWQSHMIPELLSVYWTGSKFLEVPSNTAGANFTSVSHNCTSTDGKIDEEDSEYRRPSYLNYEYKVRNGGVIMEEKPAGFTLLETKPWVPAELIARDEQE